MLGTLVGIGRGDDFDPMDPRPRLAPPYGDEEPWAPQKRRAADAAARSTVLVELAGGPGMSPVAAAAAARALAPLGFEVDESAEVVSVRGARGIENYIVTGTVAGTGARAAIEARPDVVKVWDDTPIAPF